MTQLTGHPLLRIVLLAALPAVALGVVLVAGTQTADAFNCYDCRCPAFEVQIGPFWGMGNDCPWALMDALNTARSQVNCGPDGQCSERYEIVTPCFWYVDSYRVDINYFYSCYICIDRCM